MLVNELIYFESDRHPILGLRIWMMGDDILPKNIELLKSCRYPP